MVGVRSLRSERIQAVFTLYMLKRELGTSSRLETTAP